MGRMARQTVENIKTLFKNGNTIAKISELSDLSEKTIKHIIQHRYKFEIDAETLSDEEPEISQEASEDEDEIDPYADWTREEMASSIRFWKEKYLEAHVNLVVNDLA